MLRIIDIGKTALPNTYPVVKTGNFEPGMIAQELEDGTFGPSNGLNPCGIIDDIRIPRRICALDKFGNESMVTEDVDTTFSGKITVWNADGTYQTNMFDDKAEYHKDDALYCNSSSVLTTLKPSIIHPKIGYVVSVRDSYSMKILTFKWIEQDISNLAWSVSK